jgi:hypothetical protein
MKIEIRRGPNARAVIISFGTRSERFESAYERNKFFRGLYGWEQVVKGYRYRRPGLLDEVPHAKIADSVFMVALEHMQRVMEYFKQWQRKVEWEMMEVMLERERLLREFRNRERLMEEDIDG